MPQYAAYKDADWIMNVEADDEKEAFEKVPEANRMELILGDAA